MTNTVTGCERYRVIQPLEALRSKGHATAWMTADRVMGEVNRGRNPLELADIILVNRPAIPRKSLPAYVGLFDFIRQRNPKVRFVCDFDDDLTGTDRKTYADEFDLATPDLRIFDRITVTTQELRKVYLKQNPRVTVIPNFVRTPDFMNRVKMTLSDRITIGLTGSITHKQDWQAVMNPLRRIIAEFGNAVQVFTSGFEVPELLDYITPIDLGISPELVVPWNEYPLVFAQMDFCLIPLDPSDGFNHSKSNIKFLEASASARIIDGVVGGCPSIVVSDPPIYLDVAHNEQNCLLVRHNSPDDWHKAIRRMITDTKLRKKLSIGAFKTAVEWNLEKNVDRIAAVYENIIRSPAGSLPVA